MFQRTASLLKLFCTVHPDKICNAMITIEQKQVGDILHLQQNISQVNASLVKNELLAVIDASNCDRLWLDMSQVNFIDSVGLGIIATTYSLLKQQNRSLVLCKVNASVGLVFELTGLDQILEFSTTIPRSSITSELSLFNE